GTPDIARPGHRAGAGLVEQENRLATATKQHRVPAWITLLLGDHLRLGPALAVEVCQPDFDIRSAFGLAAEPRRQEPARIHLDDGRCMTGRKRGFFEDEHS